VAQCASQAPGKKEGMWHNVPPRLLRRRKNVAQSVSQGPRKGGRMWYIVLPAARKEGGMWHIVLPGAKGRRECATLCSQELRRKERMCHIVLPGAKRRGNVAHTAPSGPGSLLLTTDINEARPIGAVHGLTLMTLLSERWLLGLSRSMSQHRDYPCLTPTSMRHVVTPRLYPGPDRPNPDHS